MATLKLFSIALLSQLFYFLLTTHKPSYGWAFISTYGGTASDGTQCEFPFTVDELKQAVTETGSISREIWWNNSFGEYIHWVDYEFNWCVGPGECQICVVHNYDDSSMPLWGFCDSGLLESTKSSCIRGNLRITKTDFKNIVLKQYFSYL